MSYQVSFPLHPVCAECIPTAVKVAAEKWQDEESVATLILPWDPERLSANTTRGRLWGVNDERTSQKMRGALLGDEEQAQLIARWAWTGAMEPVFDFPTVTDVFIMRPQPLDHENALLGLKKALDELVKCGLVKDDNPRWWAYREIRWLCDPNYSLLKLQPWVILLVRRREERLCQPEKGDIE